MKAPVTVIFLGLFTGSLIAAMADVMPYQFLMFTVIGLVAVAWVEHDSSLATLAIEAGLFIGGLGGAMSQTLSFGFPLIIAMVLLITIIKSTTAIGMRTEGVNNLVMIPFLTIFAGGLFYNFSYLDFCTVTPLLPPIVPTGTDACANPATWINGYPTVWAGCFSTCGITPFSLLGSSIFSGFLIGGNGFGSPGPGDYVGLLLSFFNVAIQSPVQFFATIFTIAIGLVLVLLSLGIGVTGNILATGVGVTINEAGTRLAQSYGIGLIMFGVVFAAFGFWMGAIFGGPFGVALSASLTIGVVTTLFYGLYLQGKNIAG